MPSMSSPPLSAVAGTAGAVTTAAMAILSILYYNNNRMMTMPVVENYNENGYKHHDNDDDDDDNDSSMITIPRELLQSPYASELRLAVRLAKRAGANMVGYLRSKGTVNESKYDIGTIHSKFNDLDLVTRVDVENERIITQGIRSAYPTHDIIGEEDVGTALEVPLLHRHVPTWIIDPMDGTTNFSQGLPVTCVSIGLCVDGKPVLGVIYAPATSEWYLAVHEHGAFDGNGQRILIHNNDNNKKKKASLQSAIVGCAFGHARADDEIEAMTGAVTNLLRHGCGAIRQLGSTCLELCYVATGKLDVFYGGIASEGGKPWDYCAALVICQEAGCVMENLRHRTPASESDLSFDLYQPSVLCATSRELADETRSVVSKYTV